MAKSQSPGKENFLSPRFQIVQSQQLSALHNTKRRRAAPHSQADTFEEMLKDRGFLQSILGFAAVLCHTSLVMLQYNPQACRTATIALLLKQQPAIYRIAAMSVLGRLPESSSGCPAAHHFCIPLPLTRLQKTATQNWEFLNTAKKTIHRFPPDISSPGLPHSIDKHHKTYQMPGDPAEFLPSPLRSISIPFPLSSLTSRISSRVKSSTLPSPSVISSTVSL